MSFFRRRIIVAALSTWPPDTPSIAFEDVQLQNSASRNRVSWQLTQDSFIPATFKIERKIAAGSWVEIEFAYAMSDPFTGYKMGGINRNFYYIDDGLTTAGTYQYRINSTATSNIVTKTGSTYYVKDGGNDTWNGLSDGNAWETIEKANGSRSAGDLVLFKRGDTFDAAGSISLGSKGNGTVDNPIVWGAYDSGNKPILNFNYLVGIQVRDLHDWGFYDIDFRNQVGGSIIKIYAVTTETYNIKFLNCDVDCSSISGFNGGIYFFEEGGSNLKTSIHFIDDVEIAYCTFYDGPSESALKVWACRSSLHIHNCYLNDNSSAITIGGGSDHTLEYTEIRCGAYGGGSGYNPTGAKMHAQQHWLINPIMRHNLVYHSYNYGLLIDTAENGLVEYNTCYNGIYGLGAFHQQAEWRTAEHIPHDNIIRNNIWVGSYSGWGGTNRIKISGHNDNYPGEPVKYEYGESPDGSGWQNKFTSEYNCFYEGARGLVFFYHDEIGTNWEFDTDQEFEDGWKIYYPTDIHDDPLFNDAANEDFTLQSNSPALRLGYTGAGFTAPPTVIYYGAESLENGNFHQWDGYIPIEWGVSDYSDPVRTISEYNGGCKLHQDSGSLRVLLRQYGILTIGTQYHLTIDISDASNGTLRFRSGDHNETYAEWTTTGIKTIDFTASHASIYFTGNLNEETDFVFDDISIREIRETPIFNDNTGFEDGTFANEWILAVGNGGDALVEIDTEIVGSGTYSIKMSHSIKGEDVYNRCEIVPIKPSQFLWNIEYWIGFRIYLEDWATNPAAWQHVLQMHTHPNLDDWGSDSGDNAFSLISDDTNFSIHSAIIEDPYTAIPTEGASGDVAYVTPLANVENRWIEFVVHWISSPDSNGYIQWWMDGQLIVNISGPNIHYLDCDGDPRYQMCNLQCGSYKDKLSTNERIVRFDDFKIAGDQAVYADVAP